MLSVLRILLFPFAILLLIITETRNMLFNWRIMRASKFDIPTIGIGNLSVGGTGKSPHTEYLIRLLKDQNSIATLSRGYGRKTKGYREITPECNATQSGDEPYQFKKKFNDVIVAVDENRVKGVINLVHDHPELDLVLLDDVFQHRPILPGLQILLTEFGSPFYKDFILPVGNLRELRKNANRADIIIITKCPDHIHENDRKFIERNIKRYSNTPLFYSKMKYGSLIPFSSNQSSSVKTENNVLAISGIANPTPFHNYLKMNSTSFHSIIFKDHHQYTKEDVKKIEVEFNRFAESNGIIVTTEKDAARLYSLEASLLHQLQKLPIYILPIQIEIQEAESFNLLINDYISKNRKNHLENQVIN